MSDKPLLYYFDGRGLAEIIRITFCLGGVEFDQKYLQTREEFVKNCDDGTFLFRCVPYLKWGDIELSQSCAIVRFVANKTGLVGKDEGEKARVDMIFEATRDFQKTYDWLIFDDPEIIIADMRSNILPKLLPIFNKIVGDNGTGYTVGTTPTMADAGLLQCLLATIDIFGEEVFNEFKQIQNFLQSMRGLSGIQHYLKNIRKPPNTEEIVAHARMILNWSEDNQPKKA